MHSRIFQITTKPVSEEDYITTGDFDELWFTNSVADYVSDDNDRAEDIEQLRSSLEDRKVAIFDNDSFVIQPGGKEIYFLAAYEAFIKARDQTLEMGLKEFAADDDMFGFSMSLWAMNNAYCSKFEFYVSSDEFGTIPIDDFIRRAEAGVQYYIGATIDYHA